MDYNEYAVTALVKERHAELMKMARQRALVGAAQGRRPLRVSLGTALIRLGAWLLRDDYAPRAAT